MTIPFVTHPVYHIAIVKVIQPQQTATGNLLDFTLTQQVSITHVLSQ